jgi:hypothetical protein
MRTEISRCAVKILECALSFYDAQEIFPMRTINVWMRTEISRCADFFSDAQDKCRDAHVICPKDLTFSRIRQKLLSE